MVPPVLHLPPLLVVGLGVGVGVDVIDAVDVMAELVLFTLAQGIRQRDGGFHDPGLPDNQFYVSSEKINGSSPRLRGS